MDEWTRAAVDRLGSDRTSGASEVVPLALAALRRAAALDAGDVAEAARAIAQAQPSMAPMWRIALTALQERGRPGSLDAFEQRWRRAQGAVARVAEQHLSPGPDRPLRLVTWSASGSVLACLRALRRRGPVTVACAEGRPMFEGRRLAGVLAAEGIGVELFTDAGTAASLESGSGGADAVLVGADAVTPEWFLNKGGTGMLAGAAARAGVPVYVAATRDKFVDARVARLLQIADRDPAEVWDGAPAGVTVRNRYFERVAWDLVSGVITDTGVLSPDLVSEACRAACADVTDESIAALL